MKPSPQDRIPPDRTGVTGRSRFAITLCALASLATVGCSEPRADDLMLHVPEWSTELDIRIGSIDDPDHTLTFIRALETAPDGRIYSLHPAEQQVRVFHPDGRPAASIGGRGDGPGEFQNLIDMGWVADTLWTLDARGYRFKHFNAAGEYLGAFAVPFRATDDPNAPQPPRARGRLFDGTIHGAPPAFSRLVADGTLTHDRLFLMTRDGEVTDTVGSIPFGGNTWEISDPDNPRQPQSYSPQPFADGQLWAFSLVERAIIVLERPASPTGPDAWFRISKVSFAGDTLFAREYRVPALRVMQEEVDSILGAQSARLSENPFFEVTPARARDLAARTLYRPVFKPAVTDMVPGKDGSIWLRQQPDAEGSVTWLVLDAEGEAVGRALLPSGIELHVVDGTDLWGTETDELDVPYIVRFRLTRN